MDKQHQEEYHRKLQWVKILQIGDTVCDCRYQHLKIAAIKDSYLVRYPRWLRKILYQNWVPLWVDDLYCWLARKFNYLELRDRNLTLSDGAHCSAMNCCDPVWNHEITDHPKGEIE